MEKESKAQRSRERRKLFAKLHMCYVCNNPLPQEELHKVCESCRIKRRKHEKERYLLYKTNGICVKCGQREARVGKIYCEVCSNKRNQREREAYAKAKAKVTNAS